MSAPLPQKHTKAAVVRPKTGAEGRLFFAHRDGGNLVSGRDCPRFFRKISVSASAGRSAAQQAELAGEGEAILAEFGKTRALPPTCAQAQALVKKWQAYLTANYYNCTGEILACLGQMYVGDERFVQHIDRYGTGTAAFMAAAIAAYTG